MGGTTNAPNNLPLGVQPLGGVSTQSTPSQHPGHGATWPAFQENYGGVSVAQPAAGAYGVVPPAGAFPLFQEGHAGVSIGGVQSDPTAGPDGS